MAREVTAEDAESAERKKGTPVAVYSENIETKQ
jgi:hypothetical protein